MPRCRGSRALHEKLPPDERAVLAPMQCSRSSPFSTRRTSPTTSWRATRTHITALRRRDHVEREHAEVVPFSAKIEAELAELPEANRHGFSSRSGLNRPASIG